LNGETHFVNDDGSYEQGWQRAARWYKEMTIYPTKVAREVCPRKDLPQNMPSRHVYLTPRMPDAVKYVVDKYATRSRVVRNK